MRHKGPIITLAGGLVLAAVLMVLNLSVTASPRPAAVAGPDAAAADADTTTAPATSAPAPRPAGERVTFAGTVTGGAATIAIAITGGTAVAYVCDGRKAEAWLQGTASDGELSLTGASEANLTGTYGNGVASGTVAAAGKQWAFSVRAVKPPSGLYRATADVRGARVVSGWILLEDDTQVGVMSVNGVPRPAPTLDPTTNSVVVDGDTVSVALVDGTGL